MKNETLRSAEGGLRFERWKCAALADVCGKYPSAKALRPGAIVMLSTLVLWRAPDVSFLCSSVSFHHLRSFPLSADLPHDWQQSML